MEYTGLLRFLGALVFVTGLVMAYHPELISKAPVPEDTFQAIERRVWWGLLIGFGLLMMFHHQLQPWLLTLAATCIALIFGLMVARLIGIVFDGSVLKQWYWLAVEAVILAALAYWYVWLKQKA